MRGSPLLRALLAFGLILLLGVPLARMTRPPAVSAPAAVASPEAPEKKARECQIALTFTTLPTQVRVRHLGQEVWRATPAEPEIEHTVALPFPKEGVDLQFEAKFPEAAPLAAMRVRFTDPEGNEHERTCWGRGEIDEVLTFP
jgi:hypothetical protein